MATYASFSYVVVDAFSVSTAYPVTVTVTVGIRYFCKRRSLPAFQSKFVPPLATEAGQALSFDGVDDVVVIPRPSAAGVPTSVTWEAWVTVDKPCLQRCSWFVREESPSSAVYSMGMVSIADGLDETGAPLYATYLSVLLRSANLQVTTPPLYTGPVTTEGVWSHVAVRINLEVRTVSLFINGAWVRTDEVNAPIEWSQGGSYQVGSLSNGAEAFQGMIDEVRVWDEALPSDKILHDHDVRLQNVTEFRLVAYYRFDEVLGLVAKDSSSYGGTATLGGGLLHRTPVPVTSTMPMVKKIVTVEDDSVVVSLTDLRATNGESAVFVTNLPGNGTLYQVNEDGTRGSKIRLPGTDDIEISQWVVEALDQRSQYTPDRWGAVQVVGEPDKYPEYGDCSCAWSPQTQSGGLEWLTMRFETPVFISALAVYETYAPGAVSAYLALDTRQGYQNLSSTER